MAVPAGDCDAGDSCSGGAVSHPEVTVNCVLLGTAAPVQTTPMSQIGRASCRERV